MKNVRLFAYNNGSAGASNLCAELGIKKIKHEGSKFKGAGHKLVINWGAGKLSAEALKCKVLNKDVSVAANKLKTFEKLKDKEYCPKFWTKKEDVVWRKNTKIVARTILNGHSGKGIEIADMPNLLVDAPLYVEYVPKKEEYRVHVVKGESIHIQRKARKKDVPDEKVNWQVRNHANGFIFQQDDFVAPDGVVAAAIDAVATLGLDFGAADVIWNDKDKKAYVLEVNTAPGIEGTTVQKYVEAFKKVIV